MAFYETRIKLTLAFLVAVILVNFAYFCLSPNLDLERINLSKEWGILKRYYYVNIDLPGEDENTTKSKVPLNPLKPKILTSLTLNIKEAHCKIVIWTSSNLPKHRFQRLQAITQRMPLRSCFEGCEISLSDKQKDVDKAVAVVFFMFNVGIKRQNFPKRTCSTQLWIYYQTEPPPNFTPKPYMNNLFNWTMTYRQDSDIYIPHYQIFPVNASVNTSYFNLIKGKTKLATAVISNCKTGSKRELIIKTLRNANISIDIYGKCGNNTICSQNNKNCDDFWMRLAQKYKFFLAYENSLCMDYITEKFWRALQLGLVPIVLGRGRYLEVVPPHSFIDLRDFSTAEQLKTFLNKLDTDNEEYSKYLEWRREYSIQRTIDNFCGVCAKLKGYKQAIAKNSIDLSFYIKSYPNIGEWLTST